MASALLYTAGAEVRRVQLRQQQELSGAQLCDARWVGLAKKFVWVCCMFLRKNTIFFGQSNNT